MYIDKIGLWNIRTFTNKNQEIHLNHPDREYEGEPPLYKNVNLFFGGNASGKTTLLEAIALGSLGPSIQDSRIDPRPLVRFKPVSRKATIDEEKEEGHINIRFALHGEESEMSFVGDGFSVIKKGELERFSPVNNLAINWDPVYSSNNPYFFLVAYSATRHFDFNIDLESSLSSGFMRVQRIQSIVEEGFPLISLPLLSRHWEHDQKKLKEVVDLINKCLGKEHFQLVQDPKTGRESFKRGGLIIPFKSLSDGYRSYLGWLTDMIYHLSTACPKNMKMDEIPGVVLVDEIDLHLHPSWQMEVIGRLSKTFPKLQFIFSSHSPLIAGSVERQNVFQLSIDGHHRTTIKPLEDPIHGLDADQILLTDLFGLKSTRAKRKKDLLSDLTHSAMKGEKDAVNKLIAAMMNGTEGKA